jgi:hypothetical protein
MSAISAWGSPSGLPPSFRSARSFTSEPVAPAILSPVFLSNPNSVFNGVVVTSYWRRVLSKSFGKEQNESGVRSGCRGPAGSKQPQTGVVWKELFLLFRRQSRPQVGSREILAAKEQGLPKRLRQTIRKTVSEV